MSWTKSIFARLKAVGITEEDDRRDLFEKVTGKRSLRAMTMSEKRAVVEDLDRLGAKRGTSHRHINGPYAKKLQALWISAWNLGLVSNRDDAALIAFVKRQTKLDHPTWLRDAAQAEQVIEALKIWLSRDGGVIWRGGVHGDGLLALPVAKVVWAQWRKLYPSTEPSDLSALAARACAITGKARLGAFEAEDWRDVSNALGIVIRGGQ